MMKFLISAPFRALFVMLWLTPMLFTACQPEEPIDGEEEIDTVRLIIGSETIEWKVSDTSNPTISLAANQSYDVEIQFWNLADNENVTTEVQAEQDEHLVCYTIQAANLSVTAKDSDGTYAVGLSTSWQTGAASTGTLIVELRHQPGEKDGSCTPGDTDVQAEFSVEIQ